MGDRADRRARPFRHGRRGQVFPHGLSPWLPDRSGRVTHYAVAVRGAIAAGHPCTAAAGARVLAAGGNAVDAAVAAVLAAFVAEGPLTGPAGGGFILVKDRDAEPVVYDAFFAAPRTPLGAVEEVVVDFGDASTQIFNVGKGTVAVPGVVAGLEHVHGVHGRLPWPLVTEPSIDLARDGVEVNEAQAFLHVVLEPILQREDAGRRIYGRPDRVVTDELVPALEAVRDRGAAAIADLLPVLADDLADYRVAPREAPQVAFRGCDVVTTPAPSRGGEVVIRALAELEEGGLGGPPGTPAEAARLVDALIAGYGGPAPRSKLTGTTHVSVIDEEGMAVGISSTLGSGSGVFTHGFQLNNMLGELDVVGYEPHAPGERLASMMTPTLVLEHGRPRVVLGSAGSVRLAGAIVQVVSAIVGQGLTVDEAIRRPRLHPEEESVHLEGGWAPVVGDRLEAGGRGVVRWSGLNLYFGGVAAVEVGVGGELAASGDPRRGGTGTVVPR